MSRTTDLMVNIYGNDKSAGKTLKGVGKDADRAGEQFKRMGKVAATAFLAVGAAAGAFALSAAKAAAEDEKSQKMLAASIKNTAKATDAQVKSTEDFITKMQLTYGVADDKLRPAFATLTRATGDLTESQNLMQTAMDVSSATGKDLSSVSLALAKAHNGNIGALTRLGIPLDKSIIKNKDFNAALKVLTKTFTGAAKAGADTFAGRMAILQQRMNEAKEQIGYALMPMLEKMAKYLTDTVVPNVQAFVDGLTGVKNSSGEAYTSIYNFGEQVRSVVDWLSKHTGVVKTFAVAVASIYVVGKVASVITAITSITAAYGRLATTAATAAEAQAASSAAGAGGAAGAAAGGGALARIAGMLKFAPLAGLALASKEGYLTTKTDARTAKSEVERMQKIHNWTDKQAKEWGHKQGFAGYASGGAVSRGTQIMVGENGPELFTPTSSGTITPNNRLGGMGGTTVVVNVAGSVIHERDLAVTVRDNIAQLMRRRGLNPAILGV